MLSYSQLQLSLELLSIRTYVRTYVRPSVRPMSLILANSYQITSILHMVLSTVTVSVFIEKKYLTRPTPSPFFGVFWGVFLSPFEIFMFLAFLGLSQGVIFLFRAKFDFWAPGRGSKWGAPGGHPK